MKVFWSWRSDTHQPSGRHFVHEALERAAAKLSDHPDLKLRSAPRSTPTRPMCPDRRRLRPRSWRKIQAAAAFVAEVTPIARTGGGTAVTNPRRHDGVGVRAGKGPERAHPAGDEPGRGSEPKRRCPSTCATGARQSATRWPERRQRRIAPPSSTPWSASLSPASPLSSPSVCGRSPPRPRRRRRPRAPKTLPCGRGAAR